MSKFVIVNTVRVAGRKEDNVMSGRDLKGLKEVASEWTTEGKEGA